MQTNRSKAWMTLILWSLVLVVFIYLFAITTGPIGWMAQKNIRFMCALLFGGGYLVFSLILFKTRKIKSDEREYLVELKAVKATSISILMYVFIFGITIYTVYENKQMMPASWMWFLAYSSAFLFYILNSAYFLYYDRKEEGYGRV